MQDRPYLGWLIAIVFLGILLGVVGGGVIGGIAGYYAAGNRGEAAQAVVISQPVASIPASTPVVMNVSVNEESAIIQAVKKVEPAVVTIITTLEHPSTPFGRISPQASGSGVIIDGQGRIITNQHVVEGASRLDVIFQDGSKTEARVVGTDQVTDLAVIQVSGNIPASAPIGDSDSLRLGETVIAIGSPLGSYRGSVTLGVVSGFNRSVTGTSQEGLIQTDAAINHGNSGGPLVNLLGQVVGINTLVVRDTSSGDIAEGLGFAIPSNTVRAVSQQLITGGRVMYPSIGVRYQEITPQLASENNLPSTEGVLILEVSQGSPAANVGLRQGDIILALDDNAIDAEHSFRSILSKYHAGDQPTLKFMHRGQTSTVRINVVVSPP
jgi:2-alkenal reductase